VAQSKLIWQSKTVLLLVLPFVAASVVLQSHWWALEAPPVAIWTISLSLLLGIVALKTRSATPGAAVAGGTITASLMFSTVSLPYLPWRTALVSVVAVLLLTAIATRMGRKWKESLGTAESRRGRAASQVVANLGVAAIASNGLIQSWILGQSLLPGAKQFPGALFTIGLAALAEAAADTVSSELGQVLSGHPRMITTLRLAAPGTDGAISAGGTVAGVVAAGIVAAAGSLAVQGGFPMLAISWGGGVFGLFFDSLLGATLERRGWLNNDAVNFISTASASAFAFAIMAALPQAGLTTAATCMAIYDQK
jgi:uncharacterized protein (TIGR00297 family)